MKFCHGFTHKNLSLAGYFNGLTALQYSHFILLCTAQLFLDVAVSASNVAQMLSEFDSLFFLRVLCTCFSIDFALLDCICTLRFRRLISLCTSVARSVCCSAVGVCVSLGSSSVILFSVVPLADWIGTPIALLCLPRYKSKFCSLQLQLPVTRKLLQVWKRLKCLHIDYWSKQLKQMV